MGGVSMRSVIVPFFNYGHGNEQLLWKFFLLHLKKWIKFVDEVYVIDSGCNLEVPMNLPLGFDKIRIIKKPPQSHWQNMNEAIRDTQADQILLLDSDMIIYNPDIIEAYFRRLDYGYDFVTILDSSGSRMYFKENENRAARGRMCPYLCFFRKAALRIDFDFTPRGGEFWTDSMGTVTEQAIEDNRNILEIPDDRATISLEDDGSITSVQWLDTPPKKWSLNEHPNYGYYHIRNFGGGLKLLKEGDFNGVPGREARRLLAWVYVLAEKTKTNILISSAKLHVGDDEETWSKYYQEFNYYHSWLKEL